MKDTPLFYWTTLLFTVTVKLRKSLEESGHPCLRASYKVDVKVTLWKNYFKHMGLNSDHWVCKTELITTRQKSQSYHTSHLYYQVKFPMKLLLKGHYKIIYRDSLYIYITHIQHTKFSRNRKVKESICLYTLSTQFYSFSSHELISLPPKL